MNKQPLFIQLESKTIAACFNPPSELSFKTNWLQHQVDVFEKSLHHDIILDLAPTGTGKTQAGLSVLLQNPNKSAVYIAPTNDLITQQTATAEKFVRDANLPHVVIAASAREIKSWSDDRVGKRSGEKIYNILRNPATIFSEVGANRPILLVTNPDIFYYATFFAYNKLDKENLAASFYSHFSTIIFDEFHLYNAKQLVGLLFYLALSHVFDYFKHNRKIVLLTATPEKACEAALNELEKQGVKIVQINGESKSNNRLPSQTAVNLEIRPQRDRDEWLTEIANRVARYMQETPDENGAVILDSKNHINCLADLLKAKGLQNSFGRIIGDTPPKDRKSAMQKQIILATNTVDVGFNFERDNPPPRQNLDWLIFSCRDRFSFWQRLGRVGRVLGKSETNIPSNAIAYLPEKAWEENITSLDISKGRKELETKLEELSCLERPFLEIYWRSEAFLEIARPLVELEDSLQGLLKHKCIAELYQTIQLILGGKKDWNFYRYRMKVLQGAEEIAKTPVQKLKKQWKFIKGGQAFVKSYLRAKSPEDWEDLNNGQRTIEECEKLFHERLDLAEDLKQFAQIYSASYAPLFKFRDSLFENLPIRDPKGLLLDESEETVLDPIHLLRFYEFVENGQFIEVISRAKETYQLSFRLRYFGDDEEFKNKELNKLSAFANCNIQRKLGNAIAPTPLLKELEKTLLPGVIISTTVNQGLIIGLRKQGIMSYPITVSSNDLEKEHTLFPGLSGILAIAMAGVKIKLPDDEDFYIA